ncbi:MAG TPA: FtsX-like permease family protein, partial [bacterium]
GGGYGLQDSDTTKGIVGIGLGRVLGMCGALKVPNCPEPPVKKAEAAKPKGKKDSLDLGELAARDTSPNAAKKDDAPHIDLLAATSGGAPNVVTLTIAKAESQGAKELDDSYVGMHLALAQQLLYGRGKPKVTGIVLQLHKTADIEPVRQRLTALFAENKLDMEVRDFKELAPLYVQAINLFNSIFFFISTIIGIVVLFTTTNTIGMAVMERIDEIGTTRALGLRRSGIRRQFLLEGAMLGAIGATLGVVIAAIVSFAVNASGLTWVPPGQVSPVPLRLLMFSRPSIVIITWVGLMLISTVSAYFPANRAAKMPVVDALRHV